jgi:hypothetical protein
MELNWVFYQIYIKTKTRLPVPGKAGKKAAKRERERSRAQSASKRLVVLVSGSVASVDTIPRRFLDGQSSVDRLTAGPQVLGRLSYRTILSKR